MYSLTKGVPENYFKLSRTCCTGRAGTRATGAAKQHAARACTIEASSTAQVQ